ncbi:MAG TPA: DUF6600 domain-containing protein [Terriglobia bacterium]|nr:DUF6600 domain-containing protein [Terriglobia bacterium]
MRAMKFKLIAGMIMATLALAGLPLLGQGGTETSTGVARVSLIRGDVSMQRGDSGEWVAVTVNTPLVPGDTIATGAGSRAEVQLDYSNVVRLADNSQVKIADLNDSRIQLQVARGTVDLAVFQNNQANSEVDTPNVAVSPLQPGTYRIDVNSDSLSLVTVRDGQAQISTPQGSTNVNAGQQITVEGAQNPQYQIVDARPPDNWDDWNRDRNGVINSAQSYDHVNRYYTGAQDLNASGRWTYVPGYDWCWTPYVDAGWVPYSNGRWVWEPFYGWTWVSYDPWGWAPYHYGRWFYYGSSWCWWPGAVTPFYRPLWAPAYVSFIGFGYGYHHFAFGFGYGFSSIGWCPLGPRDRFHRWWGHDRDHSFNVVNINNYYGRDGGRGGRGYRGSNLGELGSNFHVRRAIVTMDANRFGKEAVPRDRRLVDSRMLRNAQVVHGTLPVVPTRASLRTTNRAAVVPAVARNRANNTHFFTRRAVATPNGNRSFNNQAASIRRMVETHNVNAPGANRAGANAQDNRGFNMSRPTGAQNQGSVGRGSPAPVVRENPQGRQNFGSANGRNVQANGSNMRRFGIGAPAGAQARGNQRGETSAQVFRQGPQQRPGGSNDARATQASRPGFRSFGTGSPAAQSRGGQGRQGAAPVVRQDPPPRQNVGSQPGRSNLRNFSGNPPAGTREAPNQNSQRFNQGGNPSVSGQQNNGGFRQFTPQPAPRSVPQNGGQFNNTFRSAPRNESGNRAGWNQFHPQAQAPEQRGGDGFYNRGGGSQGYSQPRYQGNSGYNAPRSYSRPPLRFNNPIVSEPRSRNYGGGPGYYGGSRPSYQQRSAPSYRGNSGGGYHQSYSAPSHSSGGGGGHSSGGGGGGHSGGGGGGGHVGGGGGGGGHSGGGGGGHRR